MKLKVQSAAVRAGTQNWTRVTRCTADEGQDVDDVVNALKLL